jgi:hypothetical protein
MREQTQVVFSSLPCPALHRIATAVVPEWHRESDAAPGCRHGFSDLSNAISVMPSSCSQPAPMKSSERRKPTIEGPPEQWAPTSFCSLGKPNISRRGPCASTGPLL